MKFCLLFALVALVRASTPESYDKNEVPNHPTEVQIGAYIAFLELRPEENSVRGKMYFRQMWRDERLAGPVYKVPPSEVDNYWLPDTFMRDARKVERFTAMTDERIFKVNETGHVWFVQSLSFDLFADFDPYPDIEMHFESFSYTMDDLTYSWLPSPFEVDDNSIDVKPYKLTDKILYDCSAGAFPCHSVSLVLSSEQIPKYDI